MVYVLKKSLSTFVNLIQCWPHYKKYNSGAGAGPLSQRLRIKALMTCLSQSPSLVINNRCFAYDKGT